MKILRKIKWSKQFKIACSSIFLFFSCSFYFLLILGFIGGIVNCSYLGSW